MRRLTLAFMIAGTVLWTVPAFAYSSPGKPVGYVNDFAHVLSLETAHTLETELSAFNATTSTQIAVAIVPSMNNDYIENYAVKLFEEWKIGTAEHDNGVLLVVAVAEHKLRIEVGYGLEGALPDSIAQNILDTEMTPRLKLGDYDGAVTAAVHAIETATRGEYTATASPTTIPTGIIDWFIQNAFVVFFGIVFVFQWLGSILGRSKSWWAGGIIGAAAGIGIGTMLGFALAVTAFTTCILTVIGLIFDYTVSQGYGHAVRSGTTPPWWTGGGGFGGGSSSGGFGGFGGGGSGGGGASGGW